MHAIQEVVVDKSEAIVLTEAGNAFAWTTHFLRFSSPGRYRVSVGFGSMGHAVAGVVGAAHGSGKKAVAVVGDGAMLMLNEINTAVALQAEAVWIVLNDARYGMIESGMRAQGMVPVAVQFPRVDFGAVAKAMGAEGIRVTEESELDAALRTAMATKGPILVDVIIDPTRTAPFLRRIESLMSQGAQGNRADG
jgi:acetolactate synthase-1/2/3 large subunit